MIEKLRVVAEEFSAHLPSKKVWLSFLALYVLGLLLFVPDHLIENRLRQALNGQLQWQGFERRGDQITLKGVRPLAHPNLVLSQLHIDPAWMALFSATLAADIHADEPALQLQGRASTGLFKRQLQLQLESTEPGQLVNALLPQQPWSLSGNLTAQADIVLDSELQITDGNLELRLENGLAQGVRLEVARAKGVWQEDHFKLTADAEGDLKLDADARLELQLSPQLISMLKGEVALQPEVGGALENTVLPKGKTRLKLNGRLSAPKISCASRKRCPGWVRLLK